MNAITNSETSAINHKIIQLSLGLFCIWCSYADQPADSTDLFGIQVSRHPPSCPNVSIAGFDPYGWISRHGGAFLVRVDRLPAHILVTYRGNVSPEVRIERISAATSPAMKKRNSENVAPGVDLTAFELLVHIAARGDVTGTFGSWLGIRGSNLNIEGFCVGGAKGIEDTELLYQALLGHDWVSPWFHKSQFCGSRTLGLPLLGYRLRLRGNASKKYRISYSGIFVGGSSVGPLSSERFCKSRDLAPLEALRIDITPV